MNKRLKFSSQLVPLILTRKKTSTWRLWDDKNLSSGDVVEFFNSEAGEKFALAKLTKIIEKPLGDLTEEDKKGHETFLSDKEMYKTYTQYYGKQVNAQTKIKIIWFNLLNK